MPYNAENIYIIHFKDGTSYTSTGSSSNYLNNFDITKELKWVNFHILKEIAALGKTESDVLEINITFKNIIE